MPRCVQSSSIDMQQSAAAFQLGMTWLPLTFPRWRIILWIIHTLCFQLFWTLWEAESELNRCSSGECESLEGASAQENEGQHPQGGRGARAGALKKKPIYRYPEVSHDGGGIGPSSSAGSGCGAPSPRGSLGKDAQGRRGRGPGNSLPDGCREGRAPSRQRPRPSRLPERPRRLRPLRRGQMKALWAVWARGGRRGAAVSAFRLLPLGPGCPGGSERAADGGGRTLPGPRAPGPRPRPGQESWAAPGTAPPRRGQRLPRAPGLWSSLLDRRPGLRLLLRRQPRPCPALPCRRRAPNFPRRGRKCAGAPPSRFDVLILSENLTGSQSPRSGFSRWAGLRARAAAVIRPRRAGAARRALLCPGRALPCPAAPAGPPGLRCRGSRSASGPAKGSAARRAPRGPQPDRRTDGRTEPRRARVRLLRRKAWAGESEGGGNKAPFLPCPWEWHHVLHPTSTPSLSSKAWNGNVNFVYIFN